MKEVVRAAGVPTAAFQTFNADEVDAAVAVIKATDGPYVIKTDGLAAGKGVLVTDRSRRSDRRRTRTSCRGATFAGAGTTVVIEECMDGPELSVLAVCDGTSYVLLPAAQDFKRMHDDDEGPNTGGMGAYTPVPNVDVDALEIGAAVHPADARLLARPGHRLPRRALRRAHAHAERPEARRVQRALRRSRMRSGRARPAGRPRRVAGAAPPTARSTRRTIVGGRRARSP